MPFRRLPAVLATVLAATLALGACTTGDPLAPADRSDDGTVIIGSQDYYSNEIIAEIWAQALEEEGYRVDRQYRIGQREAYLPEITAGAIDLFPEYAGPLLVYLDPEATATSPADVHRELADTLPAGLDALELAEAADQDSYAVTDDFAREHDLRTVTDLANVPAEQPLNLGANAEARERPYSPDALAEVIGRDVGFTPIEDSGGPLTIQALTDGDITLALLYTADPMVRDNGLVTLEDDAGLFLASNVVPLASDNVDERAREIIDEVNADLDTDELVALNARSVNEQLPSEIIAGEWLAQR